MGIQGDSPCLTKTPMQTQVLICRFVNLHPLTIFAKLVRMRAVQANARILRTEKTLEKMVRSKGLEPSRLLGTTTSRLRVCIDYKCVTHVEAALLTPC